MANAIIWRNRTEQKKKTNVSGKTRDTAELFRRGYNFAVYLEGKMIPFRRVSGLEQSRPTEVLREGGLNNMVYSLLRPVEEERVLTLEKGLLEEEGEFARYKPGYQMRKEVAIYVLGQNGAAVKAYYLRGCAIRKAALSELNAESSGIMSLTVELVYRTLEDDGSSNASWDK